MGKFKDLTGFHFGKLKVLNFHSMNKYGRANFLCECDCGTIKVIQSMCLLRKYTISCGCHGKNILGLSRKTHGLSKSPEYKIFCKMKERCYNKNASYYNNYGGRGIVICDEWINSFITFYNDMGPIPSKNHSIDRINNDGPYSKENCRWATYQQQSSNNRANLKRKSKYLGVRNYYKNRYQASIVFNKIKYHLGTFSNEIEAAIAYNKKSLEFYGKDAVLNDV
jgi:hypothetical protein